jgi:hypothetical protein
MYLTHYYTTSTASTIFMNEDSPMSFITAITGVRGTKYIVKQSVGLYPTSGASDDYCYSRHIIDRSKTTVITYTL